MSGPTPGAPSRRALGQFAALASRREIRFVKLFAPRRCPMRRLPRIAHAQVMPDDQMPPHRRMLERRRRPAPRPKRMPTLKLVPAPRREMSPKGVVPAGVGAALAQPPGPVWARQRQILHQVRLRKPMPQAKTVKPSGRIEIKIRRAVEGLLGPTVCVAEQAAVRLTPH